jgi:hypothetical protein
MSVFELSKWYADCVTDKGDAAILYHAELRLGVLPIHYESLLLKRWDSPARALYSLGRHSSPALEGASIKWNSQSWNTRANWVDLGEAHHEVLFESDSGSLQWNCIAPRATASVQMDSGDSLNGWGYAEYLKLSVAPWRLPIRRLRWGRFVNANDAIVWIDWSGPHAKQVVYLNGSSLSAASITDHEVAVTGGEAVLHLEDSQVIRDGLLGKTALAVFPKFSELFPDSVLKMRECKWVSRAVLRRPGCPDSAGTAIHEVVEWP